MEASTECALENFCDIIIRVKSLDTHVGLEINFPYWHSNTSMLTDIFFRINTCVATISSEREKPGKVLIFSVNPAGTGKPTIAGICLLRLITGKYNAMPQNVNISDS
jgi:hypothetical protein